MKRQNPTYYRRINDNEISLTRSLRDNGRFAWKGIFAALNLVGLSSLRYFSLASSETNATPRDQRRGYSLICLCIFPGNNLPCSPRSACPRPVVSSRTRNPFPEWHTSGPRSTENETRSYWRGRYSAAWREPLSCRLRYYSETIGRDSGVSLI